MAAEQADDGKIVGRVQLEEADFIAAWNAVPETWALRFMMYVLPASLAFVLLSSLATSTEALQLTTVFPSLFVTVAIVGGLLWSRRAMAKAAIQDLGDAGGIDVELSAQGLWYRSEHRQGEVAWGAMKRSLETTQHFILYTGLKQMLPVPKRAFGDADVARLRRLLGERAGLRPMQKQLWPKVVGLVFAAIALLSVWHFLSMEGQPRPAYDAPAER